MSTGIKVAWISGIAAVLAVGALANEPTPTTNPAPTPVSIPSKSEVRDSIETKVLTPKAEPVTKPKTAPASPAPASKCHPSYSGCLKMNAGDYDCAGGSGNGPNYTGAVRVSGSDPFDLDRDNDGWGCE